MSNGHHQDIGRVGARAALTPWLMALTAHDCLETEMRLDALLDANRELAEELGRQDHELDKLRGELVHRAAIIAYQERTIAALRADVARLRTGGAPGRLGRIKDALGGWYGAEEAS